jgi:hypothetical protein
MSKDSITGFTIQDEGAASLYLPASFAFSPFTMHHLNLNPPVFYHSVRIRAEAVYDSSRQLAKFPFQPDICKQLLPLC